MKKEEGGICPAVGQIGFIIIKLNRIINTTRTTNILIPISGILKWSSSIKYANLTGKFCRIRTYYH